MSGSLVKNKILSDNVLDLDLNNSIKIKSSAESGTDHSGAGLLIKNRSSDSTANITYGELYISTTDGVTNLHLKPNSSVDSNHIVINKNNLESEIEEVYSDRGLRIKNLEVGLDNSDSDVYVNFLSQNDLNVEDDGVGFKYEQTTGDIYYIKKEVVLGQAFLLLVE